MDGSLDWGFGSTLQNVAKCFTEFGKLLQNVKFAAKDSIGHQELKNHKQ
jgi:hypothetical protein